MEVTLLGAIRTKDLQEWLPGHSPESPNWLSGMGGTPVVELCRAFLRQGISVNVVTLDPQCPKGETFHVAGNGINLYYGNTESRSQLQGYRAERRWIQQVLSELKPQVLHAHWPVYILSALDFAPEKTLVTLHDHPWNCLKLNPKSLPRFVYSHHIYRKAQHVTAVSHYVQRYAKRFAASSIPVIYNLLRNELFEKPLLELTDAQDFVAIGDWSTLKNMTNLLQGFSLLQQQYSHDTTLHLIGPNLEENGLAHSWAMRHRLENQVRFHGTLSNAEVHGLLQQSGCLIHPSREESFGYPIAEAMALGLPVIAGNDVGDTSQLLQNGALGTLVSVNQPESIAAGMHSVLTSTLEEKRARAQKARQVIWNCCAEEHVVPQYHNIYQSLLS